jgi:hypothetical protein
MCDFRLLTGNHRAFSYAYLSGVEFNPSKGVRLHFPSAEVLIEGRHLGELYDALLVERVERVCEGNADADFTPEAEPFISRIEIMPRRA